jgi:hypothetical protein
MNVTRNDHVTYFFRGTWKRVGDKYSFMRHVYLRLKGGMQSLWKAVFMLYVQNAHVDDIAVLMPSSY